MTSPPEVWEFEQVRRLDPATTAIWTTASVAGRVESVIPGCIVEPRTLSTGATTLVSVGGGTLLDVAKVWRLEHAPGLHLVAVPSIWGSGAEASPIAVLDIDGRKDIRIDERLLPDARAVWPELAESVTPERARQACGDAWAHALEGFLSPLADPTLRAELAALMRKMLQAPLSNDPRWYELSARACAGQARSSVGLVHGIAHTLEGPLRAASGHGSWGHARLCAAFLWPVMRYNEQSSPKWVALTDEYGLDRDELMATARALYDEAGYREVLPTLEENWRDVLRNACTRTNSAVVRPA